MNAKPCLLAATSALICCLPIPSPGQGFELQLQRSNDGADWRHVPLDGRDIEGGNIFQLGEGHAGFFRLSIVDTGDAALQELPADAFPQALEIARRFIDELNMETDDGEEFEPWRNAWFGEKVIPYFNPAVHGGALPAYVELRVLAGIPDDPDKDGDPEGFGKDDQKSSQQPGQRIGFIVVSLTDEDRPVADFGIGDPSPSELLAQRCGTKRFRVVFYDASLIVAENEAGRSIAFLGAEPVPLPAEILTQLGRGSSDPVKPESNYETPFLPKGAFLNYDEFRNAYLNDPVYQFIRNVRKQNAEIHWMIERDEFHKSIKRFPADGTTQTIFDGEPAESFHIDWGETERNVDVQIALAPEGAVTAIANESIGGLLTINLPGLRRKIMPVLFGDLPEQHRSASPTRDEETAFGWTSWRSHSIGARSTPNYGQFDKDPCGVSGCGPTAWAILYGWWDRHGRTELLGNPLLRDAPINGRWSGERVMLVPCIDRAFGAMGTWCLAGQAATWPADMSKGIFWAHDRGNSRYSGNNAYGVPGLNPQCWMNARSALSIDRSPPSLGIGFLHHYVIPEEYWWREYKFFGATTFVQREFYCNWGHWHSGDTSDWRGLRKWYTAYFTFQGLRLNFH